MTSITFSKKIRNRAALILSAIALAPAALAGYITVDAPTWQAPYTTTGNATASISSKTVRWTSSDSFDFEGPVDEPTSVNLTSTSMVGGNLQWRVVWHRTTQSETPPTSFSGQVAIYGSNVDKSEATGSGAGHTAFSAKAESSDNYLFSYITSAYLPQGVDDTRVDQKGSSSPSHRGYISVGGQFANDGNGNWVAYAVMQIAGQTHAEISGGVTNPMDFAGLWRLAATSSLDGKLRLVRIGTIQMADDFPGGSYATSGYGN